MKCFSILFTLFISLAGISQQPAYQADGIFSGYVITAGFDGSSDLDDINNYKIVSSSPTKIKYKISGFTFESTVYSDGSCSVPNSQTRNQGKFYDDLGKIQVKIRNIRFNRNFQTLDISYTKIKIDCSWMIFGLPCKSSAKVTKMSFSKKSEDLSTIPASGTIRDPLLLQCGKRYTNQSTYNANNYSQTYCNSTSRYSGNELVYEFNLSSEKLVRIDLTSGDRTHDLIVEDLSSGSQTICKVYDKFMLKKLTAGKYRITVDTKYVTSSTFSIAVTCTRPPVGSRFNPTKLRCGRTLTKQSNRSNQNNFESYSCFNVGVTYDSKELFYEFDVTEKSQVEIKTSNANHNYYNTFLLKGEIDNDSCVAYTLQSTLSKRLEPGKYFIAIDGYTDKNLTLDISLNCKSLKGSYYDPINLECGEILFNQSNSSEINYFESYSGCSSATFDYNEVIFEIDIDHKSMVTIDVSDYNHGHFNIFIKDRIYSYYNCFKYSSTNELKTVLDSGKYYVIIEPEISRDLNFDIRMHCNEIVDPSKYIPTLVCGETRLNQSNANTQNYFSGYDCYGTNYNYNEVIYKVEISEQTLADISVSNYSNSFFSIFLLKDSLSNNSCIEYTIYDSINLFLDTGTYYIIIDTYSSRELTFDINLNCQNLQGTHFAPIQLTCGNTLRNQSNSNKINFLKNYSCNGNNGSSTYDNREVIYEFSLDEKSIVNITEVNYAPFHMTTFILKNKLDKDSCIEYDSSDAFNLVLDSGKYFLVMDNLNEFDYDFDLSINCAPFTAGQLGSNMKNLLSKEKQNSKKQNSPLRVAQNSMNNQIAITIDNPVQSIGRLYNVKGQFISQYDLNGNNEINLLEIKSAGIYIFSVILNQKVYSEKIIIF